MTVAITTIALLLLAGAGAWDAWILLWVERNKALPDRLASGLTASYNLYLLAKTWPAIGWLFGVFSVLVMQHAHVAVAAWWWWINGHIFGTMRDVSLPK